MQVISRQLGFDLHFSDYFLTVSTAAEAYFYLGWSVIPLLGDLDPSRPKVPAIPWSVYQHYRASLQEQQEWFREGIGAGLGIVTGRISQLVVLDFDSESVFNNFRGRFPDLVETRTVRSAGRQLPHLYFRLPSHLHLASQKGQGVDLLSDGCYVVAPPTTIAGQSYTITRGGMPKPLTERDIRRLQAFLTSQMAIPAHIPQKASAPQSEKLVDTTTTRPSLKATDLQSFYHRLVRKQGRNESLFLSSLHARDAGWIQLQVEECLIPLHVQQAATGSHHHQTPAQRQREAIATIRSAFSRPARHKSLKKRNKAVNQLPNSVREKLMQLKMTYLVRTYEALLLSGFHPGQQLSFEQGEMALKGLIGRHSIHHALKAQWEGQRFFALFPSVTSPNHPNGVASSPDQLDNNKCFIVSEQKPDLIRRGPKTTHYQMPTVEDFCRILNVKNTGGDDLEQDDLASASKTRMALHRELIKRRPGSYPRRWLARRLGVNIRTIAAYNRLIPIQSRAMHIETPISWKTIERLPFEDTIPGAVLVTLKGKRYPALRTIASRLLARGEGLTLKQQTANFYWYGDTEPLLTRLEVQQEVSFQQERVEMFIAKQADAIPKISIKTAAQADAKQSTEVNNRQMRPQKFHQPLKNAAQETLAKKLYDILNAKANKRLSLANARKITVNYSETNVLEALQCLESRLYIENPTGFFITVLCSSNKLKRFCNSPCR